jgi:hypothetical protein
VWEYRPVFELPIFAHVPEVPAKAGQGVAAANPIANNAASASMRPVAQWAIFPLLEVTPLLRLSRNLLASLQKMLTTDPNQSFPFHERNPPR